MTSLRTLLPRGTSSFALGAACAAVAVAGVLSVAGTASAQDRPAAAIHSIDLKLPDGSVEHVRYWGDRIPVVTFGHGDAAYDETLRENSAYVVRPSADASADDSADPFFGAQSPFAALDRISAAMDRQAEQMFQEIGAAQGETFDNQGGMRSVEMGRLPAGTQGYSMVETISNGQDCSQSIRYFTDGHGKPQVQQASSGACQAVPGAGQQQMIRAEPLQPAQAPHDSGLTKVGYQTVQAQKQAAPSGFARDF